MSYARIIFYYHILRTAFSRLVFRRARRDRTEEEVQMAYEMNYTGQNNMDFLLLRRRKFVLGKMANTTVADYKRHLLKRFAGILEDFSARSVLELGSGRGLNLLALAVLVPSLTAATGIELTEAGVRTAEENVKHPPLAALALLTSTSVEYIARRIGEVSFRFLRGSMTMPHLARESVDVVFSNSAIEQLPRRSNYLAAFREAHRAARVGAFWSEPFAEAQGRNLFYRLYLKNIDYFRASYREVEKAGWNAVSFEIPDCQKFEFNTGILICKKQ